jgi:hypothetical protein
MRYTPFPEDDRRGSPTQRLLTVVAAVVLIVFAVILLAGPSNVLVLLNLKDLETEPPLDHVPDIRTRMTLDELRARVVNTRPRLESFRGFPGAEQELGDMRFCIYGVEPGFEVEFQLDGDAIRSVTLYPTADKQNRLSITDGVTAAVFDLFVERP